MMNRNFFIITINTDWVYTQPVSSFDDYGLIKIRLVSNKLPA